VGTAFWLKCGAITYHPLEIKSKSPNAGIIKSQKKWKKGIKYSSKGDITLDAIAGAEILKMNSFKVRANRVFQISCQKLLEKWRRVIGCHEASQTKAALRANSPAKAGDRLKKSQGHEVGAWQEKENILLKKVGPGNNRTGADIDAGEGWKNLLRCNESKSSR